MDSDKEVEKERERKIGKIVIGRFRKRGKGGTVGREREERRKREGRERRERGEKEGRERANGGANG